MQYLCLVLQNDASLAKLTSRGLESHGLKPYQVSTIESAIRVIGLWRFDVVMLDADGFGDKVPDMLSALRNTHVPILVSSSELDEHAQIRQLEHGATALATKPASVRLTALRLRKLAEIRHQAPDNASSEVRLGPLLIDTARVKASVRGTVLDITASQFELLLLLATKAGDFVHRHQIASTLRQSSEESRSVDMHISRIRRKLREAGECGVTIHTVYGRGYCLTYRALEAAADVPKWCA
jgi:DNA-binding response OmpR family regulator